MTFRCPVWRFIRGSKLCSGIARVSAWQDVRQSQAWSLNGGRGLNQDQWIVTNLPSSYYSSGTTEWQHHPVRRTILFRLASTESSWRPSPVKASSGQCSLGRLNSGVPLPGTPLWLTGSVQIAAPREACRGVASNPSYKSNRT